MDNVKTIQRENTIVELLREIEAEMVRLQSLIEESEAYLDACEQDRLFRNAC